MRAQSRYTSRPFTVAVCTACTPGASAAVLLKLSAVIGNCPHAVLVTTQCLLGQLACATGLSGDGVTLILQPCSLDRRPVRSVLWVGPVRTATDIAVVCDWIAAGVWDPAELPSHLHAGANLARASQLN